MAVELGRSMKRKKISKKPSLMITAFLAIYTFIQIYPLIWLILFSFKDNDQIYSNSALSLPTIYHWENYVSVFRNLNIGVYMFNSFIVTLASIVITGLFASMVSFAASRLDWKMGEKVIMFLTVGIMIPVHTALLPLFLMYKNFGLLNTRIGLVIAYTAFSIPLATFIIYGFINGIPKDLDEAAKIDGCNAYNLFFLIILPLLKPIVATVSIFGFLSSWNELMFAMIFNSRTSLRTLTVGIMSYQSEYFVNWGVIGAAMIVAFFPVLLIYILLSGKIQESLMSGAVKG